MKVLILLLEALLCQNREGGNGCSEGGRRKHLLKFLGYCLILIP